MKKSHKIMLGSAIAFVLIVFSCQFALKRFLSYEYSRFKSPDGKYEIVVYGIPTFLDAIIPTMPGDSFPIPGFVQLIDQKGNVLHEADVDDVEVIESFTTIWLEDRVNIADVGRWELP